MEISVHNKTLKTSSENPDLLTEQQRSQLSGKLHYFCLFSLGLLFHKKKNFCRVHVSFGMLHFFLQFISCYFGINNRI